MNFELYIPANITSYLDGFNRKRYAALCDEYMKLCQPFFDELEQCADIPAAARELAQWMDGRVSGLFKKRKFCDMQYFLLIFAAPAALERHSEKADAFAEAEFRAWVARVVKDRAVADDVLSFRIAFAAFFNPNASPFAVADVEITV